MSTWSVGHVPSVDLSTIVVHQMDNACACERGKEGVSWANSFVVDASQADAAAVQCALFHVVVMMFDLGRPGDDGDT